MSRSEKGHVESLLSQDEVVSSFQFEEFRVNLENSISALEQKERWFSNASKYCIIAWVLFIPIFFVVGQTAEKLDYGIYLLWAVAAIGNLLLLASLIFGVIHWSKYRPKLSKAKDELQVSVLADIQRQITELSRRLDEQNR